VVAACDGPDGEGPDLSTMDPALQCVHDVYGTSSALREGCFRAFAEVVEADEVDVKAVLAGMRKIQTSCRALADEVLARCTSCIAINIRTSQNRKSTFLVNTEVFRLSGIWQMVRIWSGPRLRSG
jgi:hypothetical protein